MKGKNEPLPIGSIIKLKEGQVKLMIIGYLKYAVGDQEKIFDYAGCLYPNGYQSKEKCVVFNHEDIIKVYALGYQDDLQEYFEAQLIQQFQRFKPGVKFD